MVSPQKIANTPSLTNSTAAQKQTTQQSRDLAAARQAYAEQERRNRELQQQEREQQAAEQDRAYAEVSAAAETVNRTGDELERAAARYNSLVEKYNQSESQSDRETLRRDIETARGEYNRLSGQYAAESQTYNAALSFAEQSGAVSGGQRIEYTRETIASPFEIPEEQLKAEQEFNALAGEVNKKSTAVNKAGTEYNTLIEEYNAAGTSEKQKEIQSLIEDKAAEYNLLSADLQITTEKYNTALDSAKASGYLDESAQRITYTAQSITPEFSTQTLSKSDQNAINSMEYLAGEVNKKSAAVNKAGTEYNALIEDFNAAEPDKQKEIQSLIEDKAAEYNLLSADLQNSVTNYNKAFDTVKSAGYLDESAQRITYTAQSITPEFTTITTQKPAEEIQPVAAEPAPASEKYYPVLDFLGRTADDLKKETDKFAAGALVAGLGLMSVGHTIREGIGDISENGIEGNPLTQEYTLPGNITWQPQSTAAQDAERERERVENTFNQRIQVFGDSAAWWDEAAAGIADTRPDDAAIAKGISDFMQFNKGEAEADKAFVTDGVVSVSDDGISFNRPSWYLTGAMAVTAGASVGLAAVGAGGVAVEAAEGAAVVGSNAIRGSGTATVTATENPAVTAVGGAATGTGKQNAALLIPENEIHGGTVEAFTERELISNPLVDNTVEVRRTAAGFSQELITGGNVAISQELGSAIKSNFDVSEIRVTGTGFNQGSSFTTGTISVDGYPVRQDKLEQLKRVGIDSGSVSVFGSGYGLPDAEINPDVNKVGAGLITRANFEINTRNINRNVEENRNRFTYEYWYRYGNNYRFNRPTKPRLPDIDIDLKQKGEKKKGGKKKSGKSELVEHYLPSSKDFIGSLNPGKSKKSSADLITNKPRKKGKKNNLLF